MTFWVKVLPLCWCPPIPGLQRKLPLEVNYRQSAGEVFLIFRRRNKELSGTVTGAQASELRNPLRQIAVSLSLDRPHLHNESISPWEAPQVTCAVPGTHLGHLLGSLQEDRAAHERLVSELQDRSVLFKKSPWTQFLSQRFRLPSLKIYDNAILCLTQVFFWSEINTSPYYDMNLNL